MTISRTTDTTLTLHLKVPNNLSSSPNLSPLSSPNLSPLSTQQIPEPLGLQTPLTPTSHFSFSLQQPPIVTISLEIFAKICEHLTPLDIISLSK
ncbi:15324_t:CDS:1, partial [Acaulospora morrowiae]